MNWLGLSYDEDPIYQMQRLDRYQAVIDQLIAQGKAYRCYATPEELTEMREAQKARGEKTLYDRRWRPEPGKVLPTPPEGVKPVVRFANPVEGDVTWDDVVKGPITINNREIDDLIIARTDGVPTYNFAVVVDDWDMRISHVFRGDEHVNNTPWQINIFNALGAPLPSFGHLPIILGDDGLKLSKRRGAVSVMDYAANGYLPEGMLNYLARLGWSHGDDELFSAEQMVSWFDGTHLSKSPAQWDPAKLDWVNGHYVKQIDEGRLAALVVEQLAVKGIAVTVAQVQPKVGLFKDRCATVAALSDWVSMYFAPVAPSADEVAMHVTEAVRPAIAALSSRLGAVTEWNKANIQQALKETLAAAGLKMPQLAVPVRVLVCGRAQTPSLDAVLEHFDQKKVLERLQSL
jgi:glutamyl-tRNA synthetase